MATKDSIKLPYIALRGGKPRFVPGPRERVLGFKSVDLKHEDGRWYALDEVHVFAVKKRAEIEVARKGKKIFPMKATQARKVRGYVYFLRSGEQIKIGFSKNPFSRARELMTGMAYGVTSLAAIPGTLQDERRIHSRLSRYHLAGEWFCYDLPVASLAVRSVTFGRPMLEDTDA